MHVHAHIHNTDTTHTHARTHARMHARTHARARTHAHTHTTHVYTSQTSNAHVGQMARCTQEIKCEFALYVCMWTVTVNTLENAYIIIVVVVVVVVVCACVYNVMRGLLCISLYSDIRSNLTTFAIRYVM